MAESAHQKRVSDASSEALLLAAQTKESVDAAREMVSQPDKAHAGIQLVLRAQEACLEQVRCFVWVMSNVLPRQTCRTIDWLNS